MNIINLFSLSILCFSFIFIYENDNHYFNKAIVTVIPPKAISFSSSFTRSMKQNS